MRAPKTRRVAAPEQHEESVTASIHRRQLVRAAAKQAAFNRIPRKTHAQYEVCFSDLPRTFHPLPVDGFSWAAFLNAKVNTAATLVVRFPVCKQDNRHIALL